MSLARGWEGETANWIARARRPGHDSYWYYGRSFLELLPAPGRRTLDLGCGEGRVARDLAALGHVVAAIDASSSMVAAAREADPGGEYVVGDAASLPFGDAAFDLVVAYNSLMDVEDLDGAVREAGRVLAPGGRFCIGIVHPLNSAGTFVDDTAKSSFVIDEAYLGERRYTDSLERDGLEMAFHRVHRPLEAYSRALEKAGFLVEAVREPPAPPDASGRWRVPDVERWRRLPLFLWLRAVRP
ncbi:MAG: class I SAM-dependent methyltransferase [Gaiellaceae bacterium]